MKAVALTVDISPTHHLALGAHPATKARFSIADPVEVNILLLFPEGTLPVALVSFDLLYVGPDLEATIVAALPDFPRENIVIAATHTHFAPMTDRTKPGLGNVDDFYLQELQEKVSRALREASTAEPKASVNLRAATGRACHSINRRLHKRFFFARKPRVNQYVMAPNREGATDETLTLLSVDDANGDSLAFVWNYACHPVSHPRENSVSAHFPGVARVALREKAGRDVPVLFFQGFSGNTRPSATVETHTIAERAHRLLSGPVFGRFTIDSYRKWTRSLSDAVVNLAESLEGVGATDIGGTRVEMPGAAFASPWPLPVSVQAIKFGRELTLLGISAEVVAEYADSARLLAGSQHCMLIGCLDTPFGYAPTAQMQREGGYEAEGYLSSFGLESLRYDLEATLSKAIEAALDDAHLQR